MIHLTVKLELTLQPTWSLYSISAMLEESAGALKGWTRSEGDDEERPEALFLAIDHPTEIHQSLSFSN